MLFEVTHLHHIRTLFVHICAPTLRVSDGPKPPMDSFKNRFMISDLTDNVDECAAAKLPAETIRLTRLQTRMTQAWTRARVCNQWCNLYWCYYIYNKRNDKF